MIIYLKFILGIPYLKSLFQSQKNISAFSKISKTYVEEKTKLQVKYKSVNNDILEIHTIVFVFLQVN